MAISLNLDSQIISFDVSVFELTEDKENMTLYDFFSKVAHFNPKFLRDFVGTDAQGNLIFRSQHTLLCIIGCMTFVNCMAIFSDLFLTHFHGFNYINQRAKIREIQEDFQKFLMSYYDLIINLRIKNLFQFHS